MHNKLAQGDRLPSIRFNLTDGSSLTLPDQSPSRYIAILYFRGAW